MPRLRNFCLIKDTETVKYLVSVGGSGYYSRPRNNGWSINGNFYKATQVEMKLRNAARVVAELEWHRDHPGLPPEPEWDRPDYQERIKAWRSVEAERDAWVRDHTVIPDTWVIVQFALGPNGETTEVPAKEWRAQ